MKIGIVSTWGIRCGIATYSAFLAQALIDQGDEVLILAENEDVLPNSIDPNFPGKNISSIQCWSRNKGFREKKEEGFNALEVIEKMKFDILNIQHQFALFPSITELNGLAETAKRYGALLYLTLHDVIPYQSGPTEEYFRGLINLADKIIVHTPTCKNLLLSAWQCPPEKISLVYHGTKLVDVPTKVEARKKLKLAMDKQIVLSYGFVWESKGLEGILSAVAYLKNNGFPNLTYIHAGGPHPAFPYPEYMKKLIKTAIRLKLTPGDFIITGFIDDDKLVQYFGACDVIVLNYARGSASASGAAHRSLSAGKPIIGSDDACICEIPKLEFPKFDTTALCGL